MMVCRLIGAEPLPESLREMVTSRKQCCFVFEPGDGSLIALMALAHPRHPIDSRSRNRHRNLWVGWCVSFDWRMFPSRSSVLIYIYIYIYIFMYTYALCIWVLLQDVYIHTTGVSFSSSVLMELHPITFYRTIFLGSARFLGWMPDFVFFGLPILSCSMIISLILGCLWPVVFVLSILILGIWHFTISHLPGCFCHWTFFQDIGFNMVPSDPFMSHLAIQLWYSAGEFQALQLTVLAAFGVVN